MAKISLPLKEACQLEYVRREGVHNMLDFNGVHQRANQLEFHELVVWMAMNKSSYSHLLFEGFNVVDPDAGERLDSREYFKKYPEKLEELEEVL